MTGLVVHEWVEKSGGSEQVLLEIMKTYPEAELLCLWNNDEKNYVDRVVHETWLAKTPLRRSKAGALPFMSATWAATRTDRFDWTIVSSHLFAHHVGGPRPEHRSDSTFVYVHSPARYIWTPELDARGSNPAIKLVAGAFKARDKRFASHPQSIAANSEFIRQRIRDTWDQDAVVIHPPVASARIAAVESWAGELSGEDLRVFETLPQDFILGASRFVPYKRLDRVIETGEASGLPVVLAGAGPEFAALQARAAEATVPVLFVNKPSDALLYALYQTAVAYVFPPIEDFGIMPVEAMAAGARVLVTDIGGATESVQDGVTGAHIHDWTAPVLAEAVDRVSSLDRGVARARALDFDVARFRERLIDWTGVTP